MRYFVFIFAFLFIVSIFFIDDEKLSKKFKILISLFLVLIAFLAYFYEQKFKEISQNRNEISLAFSQGKILDCAGILVDNKNFEFSFATQTFIAKNSAKNEFKNQIFKIKDCRIK